MDDNIIKGCIKNKRKSQELLYKTLAPKMMGLCMRYANDSQQAEDYLHNGFIKLFKNISKYNFKGSFEGWARRLFNNLILDELRTKIKIDFHDTNDFAEAEVFIGEPMFSEISPEKLIEFIQKLSPAYKLVFNLYVIDGYSHKEISEELNISVNTSKTNLYKAKKNLKKMLSDYGIKR